MRLIDKVVDVGCEWLYERLTRNTATAPQVELLDGDSKLHEGARLTRNGNKITIEASGKALIILIGSRDRVVGFKR